MPVIREESLYHSGRYSFSAVDMAAKEEEICFMVYSAVSESAAAAVSDALSLSVPEIASTPPSR